MQKEREEEGDEFADKESFVTPSYLKKLKELKEAEEQEKREKVLEGTFSKKIKQSLRFLVLYSLPFFVLSIPFVFLLFFAKWLSVYSGSQLFISLEDQQHSYKRKEN